MIIIGIDPGKQGCLCATDSKIGTIEIHKLDFNKNNILNKGKIEGFLDKIKPDLIITEKVQGRGGWGATQTFSFGSTCGQIWYAVSDYQLMFVLPRSWQGIVCKGIPLMKKAKDRTVTAYASLFPKNPLNLMLNKNFDTNILDAFMISIYGQITFAKIENFNFEMIKKEDL